MRVQELRDLCRSWLQPRHKLATEVRLQPLKYDFLLATPALGLSPSASTKNVTAAAARRPPVLAAEQYVPRENLCKPDQRRDTAPCYPPDDQRCHPASCPSRPPRSPTPLRFRRGRTPTPRLHRLRPQSFPLRAAAVPHPAVPCSWLRASARPRD